MVFVKPSHAVLASSILVLCDHQIVSTNNLLLLFAQIGDKVQGASLVDLSNIKLVSRDRVILMTFSGVGLIDRYMVRTVLPAEKTKKSWTFISNTVTKDAQEKF